MSPVAMKILIEILFTVLYALIGRTKVTHKTEHNTLQSSQNHI
jgi:hypothetical protein